MFLLWLLVVCLCIKYEGMFVLFFLCISFWLVLVFFCCFVGKVFLLKIVLIFVCVFMFLSIFWIIWFIVGLCLVILFICESLGSLWVLGNLFFVWIIFKSLVKNFVLIFWVGCVVLVIIEIIINFIVVWIVLGDGCLFIFILFLNEGWLLSFEFKVFCIVFVSFLWLVLVR